MLLKIAFLSLLVIVNACGPKNGNSTAGSDGGDEGASAGNCKKNGDMSSFTITCNKPVESYKFANITMSPQAQKMTLNGVEVGFSDGNKVITGKDVSSGQSTMKWDITLKGGESVSITIP
jgi:hypothetical protein